MTPAGWRGGLGQAALVGQSLRMRLARRRASCSGQAVRTSRTRHGPLPLALPCAAACSGRAADAAGLGRWGLRIALGTATMPPSNNPAQAPAPGYGDLHSPGVLAECPRLRSRRTRDAASAACMAPGARVQHGVRSATATVALLPIAEPGKRGARPRPRPRPALGSAVRACIRRRGGDHAIRCAFGYR